MLLYSIGHVVCLSETRLGVAKLAGTKKKAEAEPPSTVHALACMFIQRKQGRDRAGTDSRTGQSKTRQKRLAGTKRINSFKGSGDDK